MTFSRILAALVAIVATRRAFAQIVATGPGPNETYLAGSPCNITWNIDTSGTWNNMSIDLMSGSNKNMSLVTNVVVGLDGTDDSLSPYSWTCPEVDPYSNIYFYQFYNGANTTGSVWTTRFTIASPSNETTPPASDFQPDGDAIPWGIGQITGTFTKDQASSSAMFINPSGRSYNSKVADVSATATTSSRKHSHSDNRLPKESGDADDDNGSDFNDSQGADDGALATRSARVAGAKSAAARPTATSSYGSGIDPDSGSNSNTDSSSDSGSNSDSNSSGMPGSDSVSDSDFGSGSSADESQSSGGSNERVPSHGSSNGFKNSGEADNADASNAATVSMNAVHSDADASMVMYPVTRMMSFAFLGALVAL